MVSYFLQFTFIFHKKHTLTYTERCAQTRTDTHAVAEYSFYVVVVVVVAATILVIRFWPKFQFLFDFSALFAVVVVAASSAFSFFLLLRVYFNAKLRQTRQLSRSQSRYRYRSQSSPVSWQRCPWLRTDYSHALLPALWRGGAAFGASNTPQAPCQRDTEMQGKRCAGGVTHFAWPASN